VNTLRLRASVQSPRSLTLAPDQVGHAEWSGSAGFRKTHHRGLQSGLLPALRYTSAKPGVSFAKRRRDHVDLAIEIEGSIRFVRRQDRSKTDGCCQQLRRKTGTAQRFRGIIARIYVDADAERHPQGSDCQGHPLNRYGIKVFLFKNCAETKFDRKPRSLVNRRTTCQH
jgi:hypothetical protein